MKKALVDFLDSIGQEVFNDAAMAADGSINAITKDEQLARMVWKRALGYTEQVHDVGGKLTGVRIHDPDPKAQQFIFERREGKFTTLQDDNERITPLDRITEVTKNQINDLAQQAVDSDRDD